MKILSLQNLIDKIRRKKYPKVISLPPCYSRESYSQDGEDLLLSSFYGVAPDYKGFYLDIGAHHPLRFSNTQYFYERGWHGINIDATPNSMLEFNKLRERDINLEIGISDKSEELYYYCFSESALNGFDEKMMLEYEKVGYELKEKVLIKTKTINEVLEEYLPIGQKIDFINIDIEGVDLNVLKSLNFEKYAPDFFLIEELNFCSKSFLELKDSEIYKFLQTKNYLPIGKTKRTVLYAKNNFQK